MTHTTNANTLPLLFPSTHPQARVKELEANLNIVNTEAMLRG